MFCIYLKFITPVYLGIVILFDFSKLTPTFASFNIYKYPPGLCNPDKYSGNPIAFITNGAPILSPFISIVLPLQDIAVFATHLWSFIEIASAPAFINSFTTLSTSIS